MKLLTIQGTLLMYYVLSLNVDLSLTAQPSTIHQADGQCCRKDFVFVTFKVGGTEYMLSVSNGKVERKNRRRKVTRQELLRFESLDVKNFQWAIRTADGSHLAVDNNGDLTIKSGCPITTTFLRIVDNNHLEDCFQGVNCAMALCATPTNAIGNQSSYIVNAPGSQTTAVPPVIEKRHCGSWSMFNIARRNKNVTVTPYQYFTFHNVAAHSSRVGRRLKSQCPTLYSPSESPVTGVCP